MTVDGLNAAEAAIDAAMIGIERANPSLVVDEFKNAAAMLRWATILVGRSSASARLIPDRAAAIIAEHRRLWLARNRPGGFEDSVGNLIKIRRATASEIRSLRHRVLRDGLPLEAADFDGDDLPASFTPPRSYPTMRSSVTPRSCLPIMKELPPGDCVEWRSTPRSASSASAGGCLRPVKVHAKTHGPLQLWCNARTPAVGFYSALGWTRHGSEFDIPTAGPHYRMSKLLLNQ